MNKEFIFCVLLIKETLFSKLFWYCRGVPMTFEQNFSKNIHKASQASHTNIFSIRCSCIHTKRFLYFVNWYCFNTSLAIFNTHYDFWCSLFMGRYKVSKCWAGSSNSSRISWYINLKLTLSLVFVRHNDVHISNFQFIPNCQKPGYLKNHSIVLSIAAYGLYHTCIASIAFTINVRHASGLFAMKCITMCSDISNTD